MEVTTDYMTTADETGYLNWDTMRSFSSAILRGAIVLGAPGAAIAAQSGRGKNDFALFADNLSFSTVTTSIEGDVESTLRSSEVLKSLREGFDLNVTEIAHLFAVSRPTVYKWLKGGEINPEAFLKMQVLSVVSDHWRRATNGLNMSFLLDYKGPLADQPSIRAEMSAEALQVDKLKGVINTRLAEYNKAYAKSREITGEPEAVTGESVPKGTQKLNQLWTENAERLKNSRK